MPAVQFYDEDGHSTAPVSRTKPLPAQVQVGSAPVDEAHPMPAQVQVGATPVSDAAPVPTREIAAEWSVTEVGDGGAQTLAKAGEEGKCHYLSGFDVSYGGPCASTSLVQVKDGDTAIWQTLVTLGGGAVSPLQRSEHFVRPLKISEGSALSIVVAGSLNATEAYVSMAGYTR